MRSGRAGGQDVPGSQRVEFGAWLAVGLALAAALPLLVGPGIVNTRAGGDSPFLIQRVQQLSENLAAGVFPAHWMSGAAYGLGYPFFLFYAALPYYLASVLNLAGAGVLWGLKLTQALGFVLAGWAMYRLVRELAPHPGAALLASTAYTFAPFHLINVYVRGDALSEFWAYGLYPLVIWALLRLRRHPGPAQMAWLAGSYALLMVCHNLSALIFSPLLVLWLLLEVLFRPRGERRALLLAGGLAIGLGLLLGAWYWVPALREQSLVQLQEQTTGYLNYAGHFRGADLVQWRWIHDYSVTSEHGPWSMGLIQAVLALGGLVAVGWSIARQRRVRVDHVVALVALLAYTWLITPGSEWVWAHLPLLPMVQFPWRLLAVQAFAIALLLPTLATALPKRWGVGLAAALSLAAVAGGLAGLLVPGAVDRLAVQEADITPQNLMLYETYSGNIGTTIRAEYLPEGMVPRPYSSAVQLNGGVKPAPLAVEGTLSAAELLQQGPEYEVWRIRVDSPTLLAFHTTAYPGWEATVDGEGRGIEHLEGLGLIGLRLDTGEHQVELYFADTPGRRYAKWASLAGALIWLGLALYPAFHSRRYARKAAWLAAGLLVASAWVCLAPRATAGSATTGPLFMDFSRSPYLHTEEGGICWQEDCLQQYTLSTLQPSPGETLNVTLQWEASHPQDTVELELVPADGHLFEPCPRWAQVEQAIDEQQLTVSLAVPADIPTGLYVLRISVSRGGQQLEPRSASGAGMGLVALQPLQITGSARATGNETVLGQFGPEGAPPAITLVAVDVLEYDADHLQVALTWRSERQAPLNYALSLRLTRSDGERIATRDLPPLLGLYPTSLWQPGELITDHVVLSLSDGELSGTDFSLEVVLYDRATLQAVGQAVVSGLALP